VVGDGGVYAYIQDVIVYEEFRGRGISMMMMDAPWGSSSGRIRKEHSSA
jgi:ribosomal protein S18 acetylase RimI-like enzyme